MSGSFYTKTIQFQDINYRLAQKEDQDAVFDSWSGFLNYFDPTIPFQISCHNLGSPTPEYDIQIKAQEDGFDLEREEYNGIILQQAAQGSKGQKRMRYLTFGVDANSPKAARTKLQQVEMNLLYNFKRMGVGAEIMDGKQRLKVLYDIFHTSKETPFQFQWKWLAESGLSTKDFIAPSGFHFRTGRQFRMGNRCCAVSFLQISASDLPDSLLSEMLETEDMIVSIQVKSVAQADAIKMVMRKVTAAETAKVNEQQKAIQKQYDMDILPVNLESSISSTKALLESLQDENKRFFQVAVFCLHMAEDEQVLEERIFQTQSLTQRYGYALVPLDFQQEQGLNSCLPLGNKQVQLERGLTTNALAALMPFSSQELFQAVPEAVYYGRNATSGKIIMADRKCLKTPNGIILGTPGSGKSFSAKREIGHIFLATKDDIIVCDPEGEYEMLVRAFHGQTIKIAQTSKDYINPMDLNTDYADDDNPLSLKFEFILSLCELMMGRRTGLEGIERTVIDHALDKIYQPYLVDPRPENIPILGDLMNALLAQHIPEADRIAQALELYVTGSLNYFNHRTNVDINNRVICYDIKELGKQLKKIGMLVVQDQVWNRVTINRSAKKSTWYYMDEMHLLLKEEQTASFTVDIWKRFRKWGGIPTGITQNVKDLLRSPEIANILENSDFIYMLNQASEDRSILAQRLNISPHQLQYVSNSGEGEGLLFYGDVILPFVDHFPKDTRLYKLMTTKPKEVTG